MRSTTAVSYTHLDVYKRQEREVSLVSGRECAAALREAGFTVVEVDCGPDLFMRLSEIKPDVCFNALHGRWGEDGCVQGILEWLRIPYTLSLIHI